MLRANCQSPLVVPYPECFGDPDAEVGGDYRIIFSFVYPSKFAIPGCITELKAPPIMVPR